MKKNIDQIFKNSQSEKELEIRPELWNRLERQLDQSGPKRSKKHSWLVAASLFLVLTLSALLYLNIDRYSVEDLTDNLEPKFSKDRIAHLEELYVVPPSLFLNSEYF